MEPGGNRRSALAAPMTSGPFTSGRQQHDPGRGSGRRARVRGGLPVDLDGARRQPRDGSVVADARGEQSIQHRGRGLSGRLDLPDFYQVVDLRDSQSVFTCRFAVRMA